MDGTIGVVTTFAANFAPRNWAMCNGQLMSIAQNTALFSILGTTYGGNGQTNFALPDLRGRVPVHTGQGPGLSNYSLGQVGGTETATLNSNQIPAHAHNGLATLKQSASSDDGSDSTPNGAYPSRFTGAYSTTTNTNMLPPPNGNTGLAGGSQPFSIRPPFLTLNYIICLFGIFPSRN